MKKLHPKVENALSKIYIEVSPTTVNQRALSILEKNGFIRKNGPNKYKITSKGLSYLSRNVP